MKSTVEQNLKNIRDSVLKIREKEAAVEEHSNIWQECVNILSYLTDLSPKNLRNIRLHTEIFSGEFLNFVLFNASYQEPKSYAEGLGYVFATENLSRKYWISEPPIHDWSNPFGCPYEGMVVNPEIARYQLYIENFVSTGMLDHIEKSPNKTVVMEIGSGYGAIGYALLNMVPNKVCYIVLDLPLMLLFTGCYIATHCPDAKIWIYDPDDERHQALDDSILEYDVVLIPNHRLSILNKLSRVNFVINTISMVEMTMNQVQDYVDFIKPRLVNYFYFQNYSWPLDKPLHQFVGNQFLSTPKLSFYDDYINSSGATVVGNQLKTFFFCTDKTNVDKLAACKFKLNLPGGLKAQVDLSDESINIRHSPNSYTPLNQLKVVENTFAAKTRRVAKRLKQSLLK